MAPGVVCREHDERRLTANPWVSIETLDPGWRVTISLTGTALENVAFDEVEVDRDTADRCEVAGDPGGRDGDDQRHLTAADDEEHLMALVHLEMVGRARVARAREPRLRERAPGDRVGHAGPGQALHLLECVQAVDELRPEARRTPDGVVKRGESGDEAGHGRPGRSRPEGRQEEAGGEGASRVGESR